MNIATINRLAMKLLKVASEEAEVQGVPVKEVFHSLLMEVAERGFGEIDKRAKIASGGDDRAHRRERSYL